FHLILLFCIFFFCFFFQAEDGIRDLIVTGVQTCALPISIAQWRSYRRGAVIVKWFSENIRCQVASGTLVLLRRESTLVKAGQGRSEERRVGKECRAGWAREDRKKKSEGWK